MAKYILQVFTDDGRNTFEEVIVSEEMLAFIRAGKLPPLIVPPVVTPPVVTPPVVTPDPPPSGRPDFVTPTWDGKQISFHSKGGDGSPVKFRAIGVTNLTTGPIPQPKPYPSDYKGPSKFYMEQSGKVYGPFDVDMLAVTGGKVSIPNGTNPPIDTDTPVPIKPVIVTDESQEELLAVYETPTAKP